MKETERGEEMIDHRNMKREDGNDFPVGLAMQFKKSTRISSSRDVVNVGQMPKIDAIKATTTTPRWCWLYKQLMPTMSIPVSPMIG